MGHSIQALIFFLPRAVLANNDSNIFIRLWFLDIEIPATICVPTLSHMKLTVVRCTSVGLLLAVVTREVGGCYHNVLFQKCKTVSSHLEMNIKTRERERE